MRRTGKATRKIWGTVVGRLVQRVLAATIVIRGIYTPTLREQARRGRALFLRLSFVAWKSLKLGEPVVGVLILQLWSLGRCGKASL